MRENKSTMALDNCPQRIIEKDLKLVCTRHAVSCYSSDMSEFLKVVLYW